MSAISLPVLRTLATDLDQNGSAYLNTFGLVIEVYRGVNGNRLSEKRVVQWDKLSSLTVHRARILIGEMRTQLDAQEFPDEGE